MWTFPAEWEEALWRAAADCLLPSALELPRLRAAILDRSKRYTDERTRLHERAANPDDDLAARALFFTVADAAKIQIPVFELQNRGLLPSRDPLRVLDVGCGVGAMTLGLAAALAKRRLDVLGLDRDANVLRLFERANAHSPWPTTLATRATDVASLSPTAGFDLILAGTVVNELPEAVRLPLLQRLVGALEPGGALIVIEPALRDTSRALHELRDALLAAKTAHVFAPCTRSGPCPALLDPKDWCHEDRPSSAPPRLRGLIRDTGLREHGLKFSYLTLRRTSDTLSPPLANPRRVVSDPLDQKGTFERFVCGENGREKLRILRRERGPSRDALRDARRGDVLVDIETGLELHRPARP